jgi:hypothetical protein
VPVEAISVALTTIPQETTTTQADDSTTTSSTSTSTTTTSTTTTTTVATDTTPPSIGQQQASPGTIWELDGLVSGFFLSCPSKPREATISAVVTDGGGVASVTANWSDALGSHNVGMSPSGNTYSTTVGPYPAATWDLLSNEPYNHPFSVTITARDTSGNESSTSVNVTAFEIGECAFG